MKRLSILTLALLLTACSEASEPLNLECSVDDTLVLVADNVTAVEASAGMIVARNADGTQFVRRMQDNETCASVRP